METSGAERTPGIEPGGDVAGPAPAPRMPPSGNAAEPVDWQALRRLHLLGAEDDSRGAPRPALLAALAEAEPLVQRFPLLLPPDGAEEPAIAFRDAVRRALGTLEAQGAALHVLPAQADRLAATAGAVLERHGVAAPLDACLPEILDEFRRGIDLSTAGAAALAEEIDRLREALPRGARLLGPHAAVVTELYAAAARRQRSAARARLRAGLRGLIQRLAELLAVDDAHGERGTAPETLAASIGQGVAGLDPAALARVLPAHRGPTRMAPARRERIEAIARRLRRAAEGDDLPALCVFEAQTGDAAPLPAAGEGQERSRTPVPLDAAVARFDAVAAQVVDRVRDVRVARLEIAGEYDEERHGPLVARLDWRALTEEEQALLPHVLVLETGPRVRDSQLGALSRTLLAGRPVHVLVTDDASEGADLERHHAGLGYLAVAHREAFVVQSSLARTGTLLDALRRMVAGARPAVAVVAAPDPRWSAPAGAQLSAFLHGRVAPTFVYDPDRGETWAERFDLADNPGIDRPWPAASLRYRDEQAREQELAEAFTFAHAAALAPRAGRHFHVLPRAAWGADLLDVAEWLAAPAERRARTLPCLWVVLESGELGRALITRAMADACHDRARAWRILQELGGVGNEHARRAAEAARRAALEEGDRERRELEAAHAAEIERLREAATAEAVDRLVRVLTSSDVALEAGAPSVARGEAAPTAPTEETLPPAAAPQPVAEEVAQKKEEEEEVGFDEPWVDSPLCTTCNECTNLNGRMFRYNGNKQAYLADALAGTFEQLVRAAAKCPARCIHPGRPRPDDASATEELIAMAARYR